jgi:hypothetical protein
MEVVDSNNSTVAENSTASNAEPQVSSPAVETKSNDTPVISTDKVAASVDGQVAPAVNPYTPNYKVSVRKKEFEIPEEFRPLMTDKDKEKKLHDIFTAVHGIDEVKTHRDQVIGEFQSYRQQTEPLLQIAQQVDYLRAKGDLGTTLELLGWTKDQAFKWAIKQAELENLPPEQRQVYDSQREESLRVYELEQKLKSYDQQFQNLTVQNRTSELSQAMSRSDVAQFAKEFDSRMSQLPPEEQTTFQDEVISLGQAYWLKHKVDKPAGELVNEILRKYAWQMNQPASEMAQAAQMQQQTQQSNNQPKQVPVIPNTGSGQVAPVSRKPQSLDDLKKIRQEKYGY